MPLILPGNVASATAPTTFSVANSCRFNAADSPKLTKTPGSAGNQKRWTYSFWIKRQNAAVEDYVLYATDGGTNVTHVTFAADGRFRLYNTVSGSTSNNFRSTQKFRDVAAWYHIVVVWDTGNATEANRCQLWVNGVRVTAFDDETLNDENSTVNAAVEHTVSGTPTYIDGYMAEVVFIDGTVYTASDFGEFDEDSPNIWKPKDVSGLTFGTNGFYLDFEDSANLGNDANGGTDLDEANLAAVDQCVDTPTNNFCTLNPLDNYIQSAVFSEGNTTIVTDFPAPTTSTIGLTAGKWYWEGKADARVGGNQETGVGDWLIGIVSTQITATGRELGYEATDYGYMGADGGRINNDAESSYGDSYGFAIIGVALDLDNNKLYFAKDGTWQNSGDPTSGATGTGALDVTDPASTPLGVYFPATSANNDSVDHTWRMNFGNPAYANTSDAADANGYGKFEYAPPSGYLAICTKNLGSDGG